LAKLEALSVAVYLDACFSGQSFGGALSRTSGLGISPKLPAAARGFGVLTAAAADQVAVWDDQAQHGVFTKHLLDALYGAADTGEFGNADNQVTLAEAKAYLDTNMTLAARRIGRVQNASAEGNADLVLVALPIKPPPPPSPPPPDPAFELAFWNAVKDSTNPADFEAYVEKYGNGEFLALARNRLEELRAEPPNGPGAVVLDEVLDVQKFALANVNVRAGPATQTEKLTTIANGAPVAVTGKTGDWFQVALADGGVGYILGRYLGEAVNVQPRPKPDQGNANLGNQVQPGVLLGNQVQPDVLDVLPAGTPEEQYAFAYGLLQQFRIPEAEQAFAEFVLVNPGHALTGNAQYWLGETFYARGMFQEAALTFFQGYQEDSTGPKAADNLLKLGMSLARMDQITEACATFGELAVQFPDANQPVVEQAADERSRFSCP
jgi:tol-pal system protein YbgF